MIVQKEKNQKKQAVKCHPSAKNIQELYLINSYTNVLTAQLSPPAVRPVVLQIEIFLQKFIEQKFSTDGPTVNGMLKSCRYKTS